MPSIVVGVVLAESAEPSKKFSSVPSMWNRSVILLWLFGKVANVVAMVGELSSSSRVDFSLLSDELNRSDEINTSRGASSDIHTCNRSIHSCICSSLANCFESESTTSEQCQNLSKEQGLLYRDRFGMECLLRFPTIRMCWDWRVCYRRWRTNRQYQGFRGRRTYENSAVVTPRHCWWAGIAMRWRGDWS